MKLLEEIERLLKAGREQESPPGGQLAHEELEHRGLRVAMIQVGLHHVELVKIGEQRAVCRSACCRNACWRSACWRSACCRRHADTFARSRCHCLYQFDRLLRASNHRGLVAHPCAAIRSRTCRKGSPSKR